MQDSASAKKLIMCDEKERVPCKNLRIKNTIHAEANTIYKRQRKPSTCVIRSHLINIGYCQKKADNLCSAARYFLEKFKQWESTHAHVYRYSDEKFTVFGNEKILRDIFFPDKFSYS